MVVDRVRLRYADAPSAYVRELTGRDEEEAGGLGTQHAIALIDRACVDAGADALRPGDAVDLTAHDRDRVLAAIYRRTYGPQLAGVATCAQCRAPFDFELRLDDIQELLEASAPALDPRLRLPTGRDELAVLEAAPEEAIAALAARCVVDGAAAGGEPLGVAEAEALLDAAAPLLDVELAAACPECGAVHELPFDIQTVLLGELARDRRQLWAQIHALASAYRWSFEEIAGLPRSRRRALADLVAGDREYAR